MNPSDHFDRLERKVDDLTDAVTKLVLFEERQSVQALAITELNSRTTAVEKKLDKWINFGCGAWALATTAFAFWRSLPL